MRTFVQKPKATQHTTPAKPTTLGRADLGRSLDVNSIIHLQRMIGNQAIQRLLRANLGDVEDSITIGLTRFGHDRIPVHAATHGRSAPPVARKGGGGPSLAPVTQEVPAPPQIAPTEPVLAPEETVSGTIPDITTLPWEGRQTAEGWFPPTGSIQRKCSTCATEEDEAQAKLPVSKPNDPLEQEADRFAEQVMQGHTPTPCRGAAPAVQMDALDEAVEKAEQIDEAETLPQGTGTRMALAKREGRSPQALPEHAIPRSGGRPLEPDVQRFMRKRTRLDFAHVRVHADAEAAASASRLAARAYTVGSNIYFGRGEYRPESREGRNLLAHELAHVVQQSRGQVQPALKVEPSSVSSAPPSIQRQPTLLPPGNCIQGIHDAMQRAVKAWCDHPSGRACTPGEPCGRLLQKIHRNQMCARNRRAINDLCYNGGDVGHRIAELDARRAQANCMALFRASCTPPPVPVQQPERQPERAPEINRGFLDRMAAITGLTGTALIVYLIISEGSRLFPPRNLVPVP
jgi:hypothetical protein